MSDVKIEDVCNICTDLLIESINDVKSSKIKRELSIVKKSDKIQLDSDGNNVNLDSNSELLKILTDHRNSEKTNSKCKLCEICDLNGEILVFRNLEFIDFLDSNLPFNGDLNDFSLVEFFNHFKIVDTSPNVSPFLNKYNILDGSNLNVRNKILKGLNYYTICLYLLNDNNYRKFENEIVLKLGPDVCVDFPHHLLHLKRSTVVESRLKSLVLSIFLRELNTIDQESILFRNFRKLQQNRLLFEQLTQIKTFIQYEGEYSLTISRNKISFVGYYNKFQRNISQTNWYLDRPDIMSVEKCIGLPLKRALDAREYKLVGAGREDVNVRNIGNGRKMALELKNLNIDPFVFLYAINYTEADFPNQTISNPTDPVKLYHKNMEIDEEKITLADKKLIKDYFINSDERENLDPVMDNVAVTFKNVKMTINCRIECQKINFEIDKHSKSYNCLIYSENSLTFDTVNSVINGLEFPLLIRQKNPIRISHRRSQDTRNRNILELKLDLIHPRLLLMYIQTQSGLYIKEFVNGDLGRTLPNLSKMLNTKLYTISLDVLNITK